MSRKPENLFINSLHKLFQHPKKHPHREKMNNPYRSGTADVWYSGAVRDIWIEYKFIPKLPVSVPVVADCSSLQLEWLRNRHEEGRSVYVIVGCPDGGVILSDGEWENPIPIEDFKRRLSSKRQLAEWITLQTEGAKHDESVRDIRNTRKVDKKGGR